MSNKLFAALSRSPRVSTITRTLDNNNDDNNEEEEQQRKRTKEILFATPMRRYSRRQQVRIGGGTLRVRVLALQSPRLCKPRQFKHSRSNSNSTSSSSTVLAFSNQLSKLLPITNATTAMMASPKKSNSNQSSPSTSPSLIRRKNASTTNNNSKEYCVELTLGSAKGRTHMRAIQDENLNGEVRFVDDRNAGKEIKLFVPDEDDAMLLQAVREAVLREEDHALPQQHLQQRRVLYLKVVKSDDENADLETALDLDTLLPRLDIAPVHFNLPLISRLNPQEVDLGHLQMEVSFERQATTVGTSPISLMQATNRRRSLFALQEMLPTSEEEFESMTTNTGNGMLLMAPSAAALLAACCTLTSSVAITEHRSLSPPLPRNAVELPQCRRRLSCPATSEFTSNHMAELCHNREQLAGLREGWRMWRLADKTKYEPSHRAQDVAMVGERFLNREAASSFFEPSTTEPSSQTLPAVWLKRLANTITPPVAATGSSDQEVWCRGKTVLLTGATSGIGQEIGRELCARQVKRLVILCRNSGRRQAREWTQRYKGVEVDVIQCDLSSMLETNRVVEQVVAMLEDAHEQLDAMVLCAATISNTSNEDGIEPSFAVNYMANYLLVHALFSALNKQDARIILAGCSNSLAKHEVFDLDSLQQHASSGALEGLGLTQYMRSKSMLSCFASELSSKLESSYPNITCVMFYPGAVKSKLADKVLYHVNPTLAKLADVAYGLMQGVLVRTPQQGAVLGVFLCSSTNGVENGKVFHSGFTGEVTDFSPHEPFGMGALDRDRRQKLWTVTGKLLNQQLGKDSKMTEWWGLFKPERPAVV